MKSIYSLILIFLISAFSTLQSQELFAQKRVFTKQDSLRGSITPEREWWDLTYYHLDVSINPDEKFISGKNTIQYKVLHPNSVMQVDLQAPLKITKVLQDGEELIIKHEENAHFITLKKNQKEGSVNSIDVYYEGFPKEAIRAPWDGGFSWKKDNNNKHFYWNVLSRYWSQYLVAKQRPYV